jgi:multidrug efflux pump
VVKTGEKGEVTHLSDVGRVELGAKNYDVGSYLDGEESVTMAVFQLPGANALSTAESIRAEMKKLKARFPPGMDYKIVYDTTASSPSRSRKS